MSAILVRDDIFRRLVRARDYLHAHSHEVIRLEDIAQQAFMSPFHFHRAFTTAFNETPHEYLSRLRIERAKALLRADLMPVTEICFEVGFASLGSFSTKFARTVGCPPSNYRRRVRSLLVMPGGALMDVPACVVAWGRSISCITDQDAVEVKENSDSLLAVS